MAQKSALFFCSSYPDVDPKYKQAARNVVRAACKKGYAIVSGGGARGLMKEVVDAAHSCGAPDIGVLPRFMEGLQHADLTRLEWTDTMSERKELMRHLGAELAVALPGGIGTLDELFETYTLAKLDKYHGKVVAFNCYGFYDGVKDLLDKLVQEKMLDSHTRDLLHFPETVEEFEALL